MMTKEEALMIVESTRLANDIFMQAVRNKMGSTDRETLLEDLEIIGHIAETLIQKLEGGPTNE